MIRRVLVFLAGVGLVARAADAAEVKALFRQASAEKAAARAAAFERIRSQAGFKRARLGEIDQQAFAEQRISFTPFPDVTVEATRTDIGFTGVSGKTWTGNLPEGGSAAFVVRGDRITGTITTSRGTYQVLPLGDGTHAIVELGAGARDACGCEGEARRPDPDLAPGRDRANGDRFDATPPKRSLAGRSSSRLADTPTGNRVRVLVAYTADARALTSSDLGMTMQELIDQAILESNQGYDNSGVTMRMELACLYETVFNETTAIENDVATFRNTGDGVMDEVHDLRANYDADMCALIVDGTDTDWCGWAYDFDYTSYGNMFQATVYNCATGRFTFAHEFGHTQGCRHDNDGTLTPFAYGHGFRNGDNWRTIMAVAGTSSAPRLNYWSNPFILSPVVPFTAMGTPINGGNFANDNRSALNAGDNTVVDHESTPGVSNAPTGGSFSADESADKIVTSSLTVGTFDAFSGSRIQFRSGGTITLTPGFRARIGSFLHARLAGPLGDPAPGNGDSALTSPEASQSTGPEETKDR